MVEPSDNIGGGAPGDATSVLRAFLRHRLENWAVAIADPAAVRAMEGASPGEVRRLSIGGKGSAIAEEPVEVDATFVSASDGNFALKDLNSHLAASQGSRFDMGRCAVVRIGGVTVLLSSRKRPPSTSGSSGRRGSIPRRSRPSGSRLRWHTGAPTTRSRGAASPLPRRDRAPAR